MRFDTLLVCTTFAWQLQMMVRTTYTTTTTRAVATMVGAYLLLAIRTGVLIRCCLAWKLSSSYPDLDKYLHGKGVNCPNCVSLSPGGFYFMRTRGGRAWCLPESLDPNADDLTGVWFGKDDAYVAQQTDGSHVWNLRGHYGSLGQTLKYGTKTIKSVGLNLTDGSSYIVLWMDGSYQFNGGESGLSKHELESWVASIV